MQLAFYFDQTRCIDCYTCVVACKDRHDVPAGPASRRRVLTIEQGKYPDLFVTFLSASCHHCARPTCVDACPADAITKRTEDGIVMVDREACMGKDNCSLCLEACPYDAPQFGAEENARMEKCDLCRDRWEEGKQPVCVTGCPTRALFAGPLDEIRKMYGDVREAVGFVYDEELGPSIVFKPKPRSVVS